MNMFTLFMYNMIIKKKIIQFICFPKHFHDRNTLQEYKYTDFIYLWT